MSWGMVAGAVVGGAVSYFGAKDANKQGKNAGKVDITRQVNPYEGSDIYRNAGAAAAYNQLNNLGYNTQAPAGAPGNPLDRQQPGVGLQPDQPNNIPENPDDLAKGGKGQPPAGMRRNKQGKLVKAKGGAAGSVGGAKPANTPFQGQSSQTAAAIDNASRVAAGMEKSPVVGAAQDFTAGTLRGEDQNTYRRETADMLQGPDSAYQKYLNALMGSDTGLEFGGEGGGVPGLARPGGSSRPGGSIVRVGGSGGSVAGNFDSPMVASGPAARTGKLASGPVGADETLRKILAGEQVPGTEAMWERTRRAAEEGFNEQLRQRRLEAAGSGMAGGTPQLADEQFAMGRFGSGLADARALQEYDLYRQALGLGTQYDTSTLDRAAQERMNAENQSTARAGISASSGAAFSEQQSRERMARLGALGDAVGMGISGMGSLGGGLSEDQRFALGQAGDTNALGQTGYLNAGGLSLGSDQARNAWQSSQNSLRGQLAGVGLGRQELAFDKEKYYREAPLRDIAQYSGIIGGIYDPYASTREVGYDQRGASPSYTNPALAGISGAAAGYSIGRDISGR